MTTVRFAIASGVGSGVASRQPTPSINPAQWACERAQGQRQPRRGRESRAFIPKAPLP